jgi:hypothetical protein
MKLDSDLDIFNEKNKKEIWILWIKTYLAYLFYIISNSINGLKINVLKKKNIL